jgi:hypothetical protein
MKNSLAYSASTFGICALILALSGCETKPEKGQGDRAYLKKGQQVTEEMAGWVAVPLTEATMVEDKEKGIKYAVLRANNVVPYAQASWVAMPPALFEKLGGIKAEAPKEAANIDNRVVLRQGKSVPKHAVGWVAVPFSQPLIEKQKKGLEMAQLMVNQIVSKEMHGWIAVDRDTLAKLVAPYMQTGPGSEIPKTKEVQPTDTKAVAPVEVKPEQKPVEADRAK